MTGHPQTPSSAAPPDAAARQTTPHEDAVRLSWLEERLQQIDPVYWQLLGLSPRLGLRQAIDQARAKERGNARG